jgi:hypothetical protein
MSTIQSTLPNDPDQDDPFYALTPSFMESRTHYPNFAKFIHKSPWRIEDGNILDDDDSSLELSRMDEYVSEHTRYDSWETLVKEALQYWDSRLSPEDRAKKRRSCRIESVMVERSLSEGEGTILDISVRGVGLEVPMDMPEGGWVRITIPRKYAESHDVLPDHELTLRGLIRWSEKTGKQTRSGIELTARLI